MTNVAFVPTSPYSSKIASQSILDNAGVNKYISFYEYLAIYADRYMNNFENLQTAGAWIGLGELTSQGKVLFITSLEQSTVGTVGYSAFALDIGFKKILTAIGNNTATTATGLFTDRVTFTIPLRVIYGDQLWHNLLAAGGTTHILTIHGYQIDEVLLKQLSLSVK